MSTKLAILGGKPLRTRRFSSWPVFGVPEEKALIKTLRSGKWGRLQGDQVSKFEQTFARMHGCEHGIAVVNGTVSLKLILMAAGVQADVSSGVKTAVISREIS